MAEPDGGVSPLDRERPSRRMLIGAALRAERDARLFYLAAAKLVERRDARQLLARLANEEAAHEATLTKLFSGRFPGEWAEGGTALGPEDPGADPSRLSLEEIPPLGVLEVLAIAMWEERKSIARYHPRNWNVGDDEDLTSTLRDLQQVEHRHYRLLKELRMLISGEPG